MQSQTFKPSLEMTFITASADCRRLVKHLNQLDGEFIIDLAEVKRCDSAGLALLIEAKRLAEAKKKSLKIDNIPQIVCALAQFCALDGLLLGKV